MGRGIDMHEPRDSSFGGVLGGVAVVGGLLWLGLGFAEVWKGRGPDGVDGLVFGGLAFVAGCVILHRRARTAGSKPSESDHAEPDSAPDRNPSP
jgi:hypothetical protein